MLISKTIVSALDDCLACHIDWRNGCNLYFFSKQIAILLGQSYVFLRLIQAGANYFATALLRQVLLFFWLYFDLRGLNYCIFMLYAFDAVTGLFHSIDYALRLLAVNTACIICLFL
jgi:hypothetical protein